MIEKKRESFSRQREMHRAAALLQVFTEGEEKFKKHYFELLLIYREYTNLEMSDNNLQSVLPLLSSLQTVLCKLCSKGPLWCGRWGAHTSCPQLEVTLLPGT